MEQANKSLGQHWLQDKKVLQNIASYACIKPGDNILEIGSGLGSLTQILIDEKANIVAVELDSNLANSLKYHIREGQGTLEIINQDILKLDLEKLDKGYKVVANIPYYLTSNLIRYLSESPNPPILAVLLMQKEVAERLASKPGDMSLLSVTAQMFFEAQLGEVVKAEYFIPSPKVDSKIVVLKKRTNPLFGNRDSYKLFRLVKAGFSEKRKKLRSSLSGGLRIDKNQADELLKRANIDRNLRAQNLSLNDWLVLFDVWQNQHNKLS
jgi:16S rRNA (adenine1518-N6/adenine1519-N6)-dimethyltransferase